MNLCSRAALVALVIVCNVPLQLRAQAPAEAVSEAAPLTAEQIAARLEDKNRERALALREFEGARIYNLEYRGLGGHKQAEMKVRMDFRAPATKNFTVLEQDGSKLIIDHVFKKLLQSEQDALSEENRRASALSSENYEFSLAGREECEGRDTYVLSVTPRAKLRDKYLYQGRIWVSTTDFAVMRIEAAPAKNPSFWVKKTQIEHRYVKVGDFWLPERNRTESQIRFGGQAVLTIDYLDYRIVSASPLGAASQAGNACVAETASCMLKKKGPVRIADQMSPAGPLPAEDLRLPK
jgi:hypothetical protein